MDRENRVRCQSVNVSLPENLIVLVDRIRMDRGDPSRSDTFRFLLNYALGNLSYFPDARKKALNIAVERLGFRTEDLSKSVGR